MGNRFFFTRISLSKFMAYTPHDQSTYHRRGRKAVLSGHASIVMVALVEAEGSCQDICITRQGTPCPPLPNDSGGLGGKEIGTQGLAMSNKMTHNDESVSYVNSHKIMQPCHRHKIVVMNISPL